MKLFPDKKYNLILKYVIAAILISLLLVLALFRWDTVKSVVSVIIGIFEPIIWGAVIAFIMNPIMTSTEKFLNRFIFKKKKRPGLTRALGVVFATLVFIAVLAAIILTVIPEIIANIPGIYDGLRYDLIPGVQRWIEKLLADNPSIQGIVSNELSDIGSTIQQLLSNIVPHLQNLLTSVFDFANSVKNFVFGIIIAIYFLLSKENLKAQAKKFTVACFREETYLWLFKFISDTNSAFLKFIYGKVIDSIIIGILCCIGMLILNMPYVMIISLIVGITNIIPIFGPFIGAVPGAILVLIAEPKKVIWFLLFIVLLQQLDGNVIGPKILGSKIGLSPFWMLFSIIIFGSMFGIVGMIIGVPLFAVAYDLLNQQINEKLRVKNLPTDDAFYEKAGTNIGKAGESLPENTEKAENTEAPTGLEDKKQ